MVMAKVVTLAALTSVPFVLLGCGGGGQDPSLSTSTTTSTTTTDFCAGKPSTPNATGLYAELINDLNARFMGFDPENASSPVGVTMRMLSPDQDERFFCGGKCASDYPDCRISASLYNNRMMFTHDEHKLVLAMNRLVGIVYNQTAVEDTLGKCAYIFDAVTQSRVNHGCGCAAISSGCNDYDGAYKNQDCKYEHEETRSGIKPETCKNNTESSRDVQECWCKASSRRAGTPAAEEANIIDQQCFFKGPGLYLPDGRMETEFHDMVLARIANQEGQPDPDVTAGAGGIYREEKWNEVIIEAEEVAAKLATNPLHAYAAFAYVKNIPDAQQAAVNMQARISAFYGATVPVIEIDPDVDTRCAAPFRDASGLPPTTSVTMSTTKDPSACDEEGQQCGGKGYSGQTKCCTGLVCVEQNEYYSGCQHEKSTTAPKFAFV
jgi:hypothetical protein